MSESHEGWTNRATWNVNLWLDNDYGSYKRKQRFLRTHGTEMTESDVREFCHDEFGEYGGKTPDGDSLSDVNWAELAASWLHELAELDANP